MNGVTREYVERALAEILDENTLVAPSEVRPGIGSKGSCLTQ